MAQFRSLIISTVNRRLQWPFASGTFSEIASEETPQIPNRNGKSNVGVCIDCKYGLIAFEAGLRAPN